MTRKDFLTGKRNSEEEFEMASKPTKSHGAMARMFRVWRRPEPRSGAKNGRIDSSPPWWLIAADAKQMRIPAAKATASADWTTPDRRRRQQIAEVTAMAAMEKPFERVMSDYNRK